MIFWISSRCETFLSSGLVRTASALSRLLICCSASNMQISHSTCGGSIAAFTKRRHDPWNWHTVDRLHFGHITKYLQQISVYWPKWQNIAVEHVGNTQRATYSSTIMRDTIRGRPLCLAPSSILASGPARSPFWLGLTRRHRNKNMRDRKYITTDQNRSDRESTILVYYNII